jgi:glycosyltransferase involved in cell wall biosynthesis
MPDRKLVGIDASRSYRSPMTGTERYSRRLIEHLLAIESDELTYRLYFNQAPPSEVLFTGAEVRTMPARRLWTHYRLSRELQSNPVDLLFVPSHVIPLRHPVNSLVTVHDLGYLYEPESHTRASRYQLKLTTLWNARQARHLIAISQSTRQDLISHCNVDPQRITVIRHGVDDRFRVLSREEIYRYSQAAKLPEKFILYLGTIQPRKNLVRLIESFELVAHQDPDMNLVLAGRTGWLAEPITRRADASPFRNRIRFTGHIPDEQLVQLYNAATVFALPSLYEGFGLPALEAQACGVPAVVSNRGALPELAGAEMAIVDPGNSDEIASAIAKLVHQRFNTDLVNQRVEHARGFTWSNSAMKTRKLFQEMLAI